MSSLVIIGFTNACPLEIHNHVVNYYNEFFLESGDVGKIDDSLVSQVTPNLVYDKDNILLLAISSGLEVKAVVFDMDQIML